MYNLYNVADISRGIYFEDEGNNLKIVRCTIAGESVSYIWGTLLTDHILDTFLMRNRLVS